jgi:hypothetical protein
LLADSGVNNQLSDLPTPTTVLFDGRGIVVWLHEGILTSDQLKGLESVLESSHFER